MGRPNALQQHTANMARRKAQLVREGKLPPSAAGGRPAILTPCVRCGEVQPSARAAWLHCRKKKGETK